MTKQHRSFTVGFVLLAVLLAVALVVVRNGSRQSVPALPASSEGDGDHPRPTRGAGKPGLERALANRAISSRETSAEDARPGWSITLLQDSPPTQGTTVSMKAFVTTASAADVVEAFRSSTGNELPAVLGSPMLEARQRVGTAFHIPAPRTHGSASCWIHVSSQSHAVALRMLPDPPAAVEVDLRRTVSAEVKIDGNLGDSGMTSSWLAAIPTRQSRVVPTGPDSYVLPKIVSTWLAHGASMDSLVPGARYSIAARQSFMRGVLEFANMPISYAPPGPIRVQAALAGNYLEIEIRPKPSDQELPGWLRLVDSDGRGTAIEFSAGKFLVDTTSIGSGLYTLHASGPGWVTDPLSMTFPLKRAQKGVLSAEPRPLFEFRFSFDPEAYEPFVPMVFDRAESRWVELPSYPLGVTENRSSAFATQTPGCLRVTGLEPGELVAAVRMDWGSWRILELGKTYDRRQVIAWRKPSSTRLEKAYRVVDSLDDDDWSPDTRLYLDMGFAVAGYPKGWAPIKCVTLNDALEDPDVWVIPLDPNTEVRLRAKSAPDSLQATYAIRRP